MNNLIGGLFQTQEHANQAYEALRQAGVPAEQIALLIRKPRRDAVLSTQISIQEIGRSALVGGMSLGSLGAFLGLLVGLGVLPHPYLEPGNVTRDALFIFMSVLGGLIPAGLIGVILGAASRLLRSREKAEVMTREIDKRGVLVTVGTNGSQTETSVRRLLEEQGAVEIGRSSEKWDMDTWVSPNEASPPLENAADTR
jgi:hypothetical protein